MILFVVPKKRKLVCSTLSTTVVFVAWNIPHNAKSSIHENNGLTIGEQKNAIQNCYNPLLIEVRHMPPHPIKSTMFDVLKRPAYISYHLQYWLRLWWVCVLKFPPEYLIASIQIFKCG